MNTWLILKKEISYYGIRLINDRECQLYDSKGSLQTQGIIKTLRQFKGEIKKQKKLFSSLWKEVVSLLMPENVNDEVLYDDNMKNLFIFSLKDLYKFILCFEDLDGSELSEKISSFLNRDINSFTKEQIQKLPDYKISIDWVHRLINRLIYICKLLAVAATGRINVSQYTVKTARGISGPWSNLDLPMEERVYPFEEEEQRGRGKDKEYQRRYRKNLETYNSSGFVGEGHYWRELRNEPYSWYDRRDESPYPMRELLNR